jgi:hypothetical protein
MADHRRPRAGIDHDTLPASMRAIAVWPGDEDYPRLRSTFWRSGSPHLVLLPENVDEVREALGFARGQDVPIAIRSGGHGISGRSTTDGGIVIDLRKLDQVEVLDQEAGRIRLGPGARWGHVAWVLLPHGLATSSADYGNVGVGGLVTAGGIGLVCRKFGLTIDHITAVELVLADGTLVRADATEHPDLFWAVRGAGANFGIVTAVELDAHPLHEVVFSTVAFDASAAAAVLEQWGRLAENAPRELTSFLKLVAPGSATPIVQLNNVYAGDDATAAVEALRPFLEIGPLLDAQASLVPYADVVPLHDDHHTGRHLLTLASNGLADHLTAEVADQLVAGLRGGATQALSIRACGGAVNDVEPRTTAYPHRHQNFSISSMGSDEDDFHRHWDSLRPHLDGLYLSFETDQRPERLHDAFPGETLCRLRVLKGRYDPDNVFDQNFPIPPAGQDGGGASAVTPGDPDSADEPGGPPSPPP